MVLAGYPVLPSRHPPSSPPPRVHPCPTEQCRTAVEPWYGGAARLNSVVGLNSVDQLSLSVRFSGFEGMTEVYNLLKVGRINNHLYIPGNEQAGVSNLWTGPLFYQQWSIKL